MSAIRGIAAVAPRRRQPVRKRDNKAAYLFLLPWFLGLLVITVGPMLASLYLSFTDYNLLQAAGVHRAGQLHAGCSPTTGCTTRCG